MPPELMAYRAIRISNDLYGSDVLSSFETAKGFTKPCDDKNGINVISKDLINAHDTIKAKRKLNLILRSNSRTESQVGVGDMFEIYIKRQHEKRGKWSSPRVVLSYDPSSRTITVPGAHEKTISSAIEDTRFAIQDDPFAIQIQQSIDQLDTDLENVIDCKAVNRNTDDCDYENNDETAFHHQYSTSDCDPELPQAGDCVDVFWPLDNSYYSGTFQSIDEDGRHNIEYDDGEDEVLDMTDGTWRFSTGNTTSSSVSAQSSQFSSIEPVVLQEMQNHFGNKSFMRHQAQGFPQFALVNAYNAEETSFKKTAEPVRVSKIPPDANIISSHVIYKVKMNDDKALKLKARIAPHGNEDSLKHDLRSDCCVWPLTGIRLLLSMASLRKWRITKMDVESAFLQTGDANRNVYVVPPRESKNRSFYWLLLTAAYGLVNANAKWQVQSDNLLFTIGHYQLAYVLQLFYLHRDGRLVLLVVKTVDDILATSPDHEVDLFVSQFNHKFKHGTIAHGPGLFRFFGPNITQLQDYSCHIKGDDKLESLEGFPTSRLRRRRHHEALNTVKISA